MMDKIIDFKPGHLDFINDEDIFTGDGGMIDIMLDFYANNAALQKTFIKDSKPIAFMGMTVRWPSLGEVYSYPTKLVRKWPKYYFENTKYHFEHTVAQLKLKRVHAYLADTDVNFISQQWIERLGFKKECLMEKFIGNTAYYQYARIFQ